MIAEYRRILTFETYPARREEIEQQILICKDEISQLKNGKPLFGRPKQLKQTTRIIEADREKPGGQKITLVSEHKLEEPTKKEKEVVAPAATTPKKSKLLRNALRDRRKAKLTELSENSLKAKVAAAKAAKKNI